jgi:hypothetical protein
LLEVNLLNELCFVEEGQKTRFFRGAEISALYKLLQK